MEKFDDTDSQSAPHTMYCNYYLYLYLYLYLYYVQNLFWKSLVEKFDDTDICIMYEENPAKVWWKSLTIQIPNQLLTRLHSDLLLVLKVNLYILQLNTNKVIPLQKVLDPEAQPDQRHILLNTGHPKVLNRLFP